MNEKSIAENLEIALRQSLTWLVEASIKTIGAGVHWKVQVERLERSLTTHCFSYNNRLNGAEYLTIFLTEGDRTATGRTISLPQTVEAIEFWIRGHSIEELYKKFSFVDEGKRALSSLQSTIETAFNGLPGDYRISWKFQFSDFHELWIYAGERSCQLATFSAPPKIVAKFQWDETYLFETTTDNQVQFIALLRQWLIDKALPSALRIEFPHIDIGILADYFEQGQPIEGEFTLSWDFIEKWYRKEAAYLPVEEILAFLRELRRLGFDHTLRAGQSLWTLVLSRSRRHGLSVEQPCIRIHFGPHRFSTDALMMYASGQEEPTLKLPRYEVTDEVIAILRQLEAEPIT